jgi:Amt family ammonium transporter
VPAAAHILSEMTPLVAVGVLASLLATAGVLTLVRPVLRGRMVWAAFGAAGATVVVTTLAGLLTDAAPASFLVGLSVFTLPVLTLLETAAVASGADRFARWLLMVVWGVVVFPVALIVPLLVTGGCAADACGFVDFGGALPLLASAAAFVLLAWLPAGVHEHAPVMDAGASRRAIVAIVVVWVAFAGWLAHLESVVDEYIPRILLSAAVGPTAAALGWLLVDRLREVHRPVTRSLGLGLVAGIAASLPGAVSVGLPWSPMVGALAGAMGALVFSTAAASRAGLASRWALALLLATAVGFLAPAVSGEAVGVLFTARWAGLSAPVVAFLGVTLFAMLVSAPVWVLVRRHASRERIPADILDEPGEPGPGEPGLREFVDP